MFFSQFITTVATAFVIFAVWLRVVVFFFFFLLLEGHVTRAFGGNVKMGPRELQESTTPGLERTGPMEGSPQVPISEICGLQSKLSIMRRGGTLLNVFCQHQPAAGVMANTFLLLPRQALSADLQGNERRYFDHVGFVYPSPTRCACLQKYQLKV